MGELPEPAKVKQHLSPLEAKAFETLVASGLEGMTRIDLSISIHGDNGTEDKKLGHTSAIISDLRRRIQPFGYHIQRLRTHGPDNSYRVIPAEVTP
jgi:hypothetical protein